VNRRTKSYEYADDRRRPSVVSIAPAPIVIKIPDMTELVQAAQLSRLQNRRESTEMVKILFFLFKQKTKSFLLYLF
jgi:hypothetical protein